MQTFVLTGLHMKLELNWPSGFREDVDDGQTDEGRNLSSSSSVLGPGDIGILIADL